MIFLYLINTFSTLIYYDVDTVNANINTVSNVWLPSEFHDSCLYRCRYIISIVDENVHSNDLVGCFESSTNDLSGEPRTYIEEHNIFIVSCEGREHNKNYTLLWYSNYHKSVFNLVPYYPNNDMSANVVGSVKTPFLMTPGTEIFLCNKYWKCPGQPIHLTHTTGRQTFPLNCEFINIFENYFQENMFTLYNHFVPFNFTNNICLPNMHTIYGSNLQNKITRGIDRPLHSLMKYNTLRANFGLLQAHSQCYNELLDKCKCSCTPQYEEQYTFPHSYCKFTGINIQELELHFDTIPVIPVDELITNEMFSILFNNQTHLSYYSIDSMKYSWLDKGIINCTTSSEDVCVTLSTGWNAFSLKLNTSIVLPTEGFSNGDIISYYDFTIGSVSVYYLNGRWVPPQLEYLNSGIGYMIYVNSISQICYSGSEFTSSNTRIQPGFRSIGLVSNTSVSMNNFYGSADDYILQLENGNLVKYSSSNWSSVILYPGYAYIFNLNSTAVL